MHSLPSEKCFVYTCTGQLHVGIAVRIQTLSLSDASCPDVVVVAASGGDMDTLTKYLRHHPEHVSSLLICSLLTPA